MNARLTKEVMKNGGKENGCDGNWPMWSIKHCLKWSAAFSGGS